MRDRARWHFAALAVVLLACAIGQAIVLVQTPLVAQEPDTQQYLSAATHILTSLQLVDPWRTPGYPAFLALVFTLTGWEHLRAVVYAQAALVVMAAVEVYVLAYRIRGRRWEAALIAALIGIDPFVIDFERSILTEAMCYWLVVSLFLVFERVLARRGSVPLAWLVATSVALILTRPQYIFLPVLLALVVALRDGRMRTLIRSWKPLAYTLVLTYALIVCYVTANGAVNGYLGLSDISNLNLFGKVLEYRMYRLPDAGNDPRFTQFQADVNAYMATDHQTIQESDVWNFVFEHPQYDLDNWAIYGAYSTRLTEHHPLYFLERTVPDILLCGYHMPLLWATYSYIPAWVIALVSLFAFLTRAFVFLPVIILAMAIEALRKPPDAGRWALFALALAIVGNIAMIAATDFVEFARLRSPLDWGMIVVFIVAVIDTVQWLAARLAVTQRDRKRQSLAGVGSPWRLSAWWGRP